MPVGFAHDFSFLIFLAARRRFSAAETNVTMSSGR
jgi:hypothetical protein